ncbi:ABC transporter permease, partial [bacterium]|nr:ABC transporter permease [bacterium]
MGFEMFLAGRYLRSPRKDRSISVITKIAVGGVAVGVLVLITALSMMNGMEKEMREALRGAESDLTVYSMSMGGFPWGPDNSLIDRIKEAVEIKAYAPFTSHQALINGPQKSAGTLIKGIDGSREADVVPIEFFIRTESFETKRDNSNPGRKIGESERLKAKKILAQLKPHLEPFKDADGNVRQTKTTGIIIGSQLARNLEVRVGGFVTVMSPETRMSPMGEIPRSKRFKVVGFFESGLPGYDEVVSYIDIGIAQKIYRMQGHISGLTISIEDGEKADVYKDKLREQIGFPYFFTTWMENNKNMFATFQLERFALGIILTLIILLASFLIVS